jgi:hypothetical protein
MCWNPVEQTVVFERKSRAQLMPKRLTISRSTVCTEQHHTSRPLSLRYTVTFFPYTFRSSNKPSLHQTVPIKCTTVSYSLLPLACYMPSQSDPHSFTPREILWNRDIQNAVLLSLTSLQFPFKHPASHTLALCCVLHVPGQIEYHWASKLPGRLLYVVILAFSDSRTAHNMFWSENQ